MQFSRSLASQSLECITGDDTAQLCVFGAQLFQRVRRFSAGLFHKRSGVTLGVRGLWQPRWRCCPGSGELCARMMRPARSAVSARCWCAARSLLPTARLIAAGANSLATAFRAGDEFVSLVEWVRCAQNGGAGALPPAAPVIARPSNKVVAPSACVIAPDTTPRTPLLFRQRAFWRGGGRAYHHTFGFGVHRGLTGGSSAPFAQCHLLTHASIAARQRHGVRHDDSCMTLVAAMGTDHWLR